MAHNYTMRIRGWVLIFVLTAALLLCSLPAALAASGEDVILVTIDNCSADSDYMLLLVEPGTSASSIGENNLLFADQVTSSGSTIRAAVVLPSFAACDVYAGGEFSNGAASPRKVASYNAGRLPTSTAEIEESAFENTAFTHMFLSNRVTVIGRRAFADCSDLVYVYIPSSVTQIDSSAFAGSTHVTIGCQAGSEAYDFAVNSGLPYVIVSP